MWLWGLLWRRLLPWGLQEVRPAVRQVGPAAALVAAAAAGEGEGEGAGARYNWFLWYKGWP